MIIFLWIDFFVSNCDIKKWNADEKVTLKNAATTAEAIVDNEQGKREKNELFEEWCLSCDM